MKPWSTEQKLFLTTWLVYAIYVTPAGGVTPNRYVDLVHSIVNEGRFVIDTYQDNTIDKAYFGGHYYAGALPGPSFIAAPVYLIFKGLYSLVPSQLRALANEVQSYKKQNLLPGNFYEREDNLEFFLSHAFLAIFVIGLMSALSGSLLFKTVRLMGYDNQIAFITTILYSFGTIVFFYSTLFFEQIVSASLAIGAFYLILRSRGMPYSSKIPLISLAGFLAGFGLLVEYTSLFVGLWLVALLLTVVDKQSLVFYGFGYAIPALLLLGYDYVLFGNPFATPYAYLIPEHQSVHGVGLMGITTPSVDRLLSLIFGNDGGLFVFAPILVLGVLGIVCSAIRQRPNRAIALICLGIIATHIAFFSSYVNWRGGAAFGPRYLIAVIPFISIGFAYALDFLPKRIVYLFGIISIFINWLGVQFGFAESILQPFQTFLAQGPTLPVFGAILTHSTSHTSPLYIFALSFHVPITLVTSIGLIALVYLIWRDVRRADQEGALIARTRPESSPVFGLDGSSRPFGESNH